MPTMDQLLTSVEDHRDEMIKQMTAMLRIPAMGPENGGQGEVERSLFIHDLLHHIGFNDVRTYNAPDERVEPKKRPSIIARKQGRSDRTVWIVSHMDTVSPGDEKAWTYPPFDGTVVDGKLYGRGSEDNGQAVISSMFAAQALLDQGLDPELSLGLAIVADEEAGSDYGIKYLLKQKIFGPDDLFYVPDAGEADGSVIEVAEKSIIWFRVSVKGKQIHASTPKKGLNALRVGSELLLFLSQQLSGHFPAEDPLFYPSGSTFEPTKRMANVENINTIPGEDITFFDIRLLPLYDPEECVKVAKEVGELFERRTGAVITIDAIRIDPAGKASRTGGEGAKALITAVDRVLGVRPRMMGIGGQTCANWFRQEGLDAYVWETLDEMAHQVNEYTRVDNLVNDAKVFAVLLAHLCYPGAFTDPQPEY
ncbi:MAG: M20 family metallo-hydrolase [Methanomassiliicoccus sp.]|nr:M20 family metallo-hydrolase [Methanomassiliicoccus sp.]